MAHFSGLVIEGQPQREHRSSARARHFSGLVIEGQPQRDLQVINNVAYFSGLVIEGQPQPSRAKRSNDVDFSGLVIEGQPQLTEAGRNASPYFSGLVIEGQPQPALDLHSNIVFQWYDFFWESTAMSELATAKEIDFGWARAQFTGSVADDYFKNLDNYLNGSPELWYYVGNNLSPDAVIFDCGANIGATTIMMATRCPEGHVYSFEASPTTAAILRRNVELNSLKNVTVIEGPLGYDVRKVKFHESHFGAGSHIKSEEGVAQPLASTIELQTRTIDDFVRSGEFLHDKISFMKMDVEGYEPAALLGAQSSIKKYAFPIFIEINSFSIAFAHKFDPIEFVQFLWNEFNVKRVEIGGSISDAGDMAGFIYNNMILKQCVDDILIAPKNTTSFLDLEKIVTRWSPLKELKKSHKRVIELEAEISRRDEQGFFSALFERIKTGAAHG